MRKTIKVISVLATAGIMALFSLVVYYTINLPDEFYVTEGNKLKLSCAVEITAESAYENAAQPASSMGTSESAVDLKLFGVVPIKEVKVQPVSQPVLIPGGSPFGIKMLTEGVVVIGLGDVDTSKGFVGPAKQAGIKIGDIILSVQGQELLSNKDLAAIIEQSEGKPVEIVLRRGQTTHTFSVTPVLSQSSGTFKAGIWVRDSSAGIGTITYYDPQTSAFGGLGHPVCDVDTGEILPLMSGDVVAVSISGVTMGAAGSPGELVGNFISKTAIGKLLMNTETGIFGTLDFCPVSNKAIPMAMRQNIQVGPATILTTIEGTEPKEYDIMIEKIDLKDTEITKNMVIRVTDPDLLSKTGGIVQGMSGSPILQNGTLVGAVTHVFINEPTKGYAIFCENMYNFSQNIENEAA